MRRGPTKSEAMLWRRLRGGGLGVKFRRQHPVHCGEHGAFIVDFCCLGAGLVIEIDGASHRGREEEDRRRDAELARRGLRVMRVSADDVEYGIEGVLELIRRAVA